MENSSTKEKLPLQKFLHSRWVPLAGLVLGILLLILGSLGSLIPEKKEEVTYTVEYYTDILERRITELCTSIQGITEATVLLTLDSGSEYVYAQNGSSGMQAWDYVIVSRNTGEDTVLVTEIYPKIRGVAVVCTGGETVEVQRTIIELLSASLGISSNRIRVAGR